MKPLLNQIKKILFVGLGGAGQRHLRIFNQLLSPATEFLAYRSTSHTPMLNPDFSVAKGSSLEKHFRLNLFDSLESAYAAKPDVAVIATPTSMHLEAAQKAAENHIHVFVEKPLSHSMTGVDTLISTITNKQLLFFITFQRRFHPLLQKIKNLLIDEALGKVIASVFNVGSFLPAWHPYEDFHQLYACRKDLGGGVLLTEIHELDLCNWYFGLPESVSCIGGNFSDIPMDVEDTAHVTLKYSQFSVQVNLCFMQKHIQRHLRIAGTKGFIEWDESGNTLIWVDYINNRKTNLSDPTYTNDKMFTSQASYFLREMTPTESVVNLESARASQAMVEAAQESMQTGQLVKLN